jgi:hypothetical protein
MFRPTGARTGTILKYEKLTFFACEGLIVLHDEREAAEDYNVILPDDFLERARELNRLGKECTSTDSQRSLRETGRKYMQGASDMRLAAKEAKDMGDPSDPAVQAFWARHRPGRKSRVSLRAGSDKAGYPQLPELPRGKNTGKTAAVDGKAKIVDQDTHLRIHTPPRRKRQLVLDV